MKVKHYLNVCYVLFCALIWGSTSLVSTIGFKYFNISSILFWGSFLSAVLFFIVICLTGRASILYGNIKQNSFKLLFFGIIICCYYNIMFRGLQIGPTAPAYVINFLWGIFILPLSCLLLKETIRVKNYIAILVSFLGVGILIFQGKFNTQISIAYLFMLIAAFIYALYSVLNKKWEIDRLSVLFCTFAIMCVSQLFIGIYNSSILLSIHLEGVFSIIYIGLLPMGIAHLLWLKALTQGQTAYIANMIYTAPIFNILFMGIFTDDVINYGSTIVGTLLMISGILFQKYLQKGKL